MNAGSSRPAPPNSTARAAVLRLTQQYGDQLYSLALKICRGPEDAEDLVQNIYLLALRNWDQFEGRSDPRTWLYTIAIRACRRLHRRRAGQPKRLASLHDHLPTNEKQVAALACGSVDCLSSQVRRESLEAIQVAIVSLPETDRMPLILKDIVGMSIEDVAQVLGLKEGTVKARLHRTRLRLRKAVVRALPARAAPPVFETKVFLDVLQAKQEALDRGAPFPLQNELLCERCRDVCRTLDITHDLCGQCAKGHMPKRVRDRLRTRIEAAS